MLEADKNAASETNIASMYVLESLFLAFYVITSSVVACFCLNHLFLSFFDLIFDGSASGCFSFFSVGYFQSGSLRPRMGRALCCRGPRPKCRAAPFGVSLVM